MPKQKGTIKMKSSDEVTKARQLKKQPTSEFAKIAREFAILQLEQDLEDGRQSSIETEREDYKYLSNISSRRISKNN